MIITRLIMYLFNIWQMQKIEQVMPDLSVILPAPETSYLIFKNTFYWNIYDIPMIRLGFAGHVFLGLSDPWRANTGTKLQNKKYIKSKNIKNGCFSPFLDPRTIKIQFGMSKNPCIQILSSFGSGSVELWRFYVKNMTCESKPNHWDVNIFSVNRVFEN